MQLESRVSRYQHLHHIIESYSDCCFCDVRPLQLMSVTESYNYPPPAPVQKIIPGQWYTAKVEPMAFWRSRITVPGRHRSNAAARDKLVMSHQ